MTTVREIGLKPDAIFWPGDAVYVLRLCSDAALDWFGDEVGVEDMLDLYDGRYAVRVGAAADYIAAMKELGLSVVDARSSDACAH